MKLLYIKNLLFKTVGYLEILLKKLITEEPNGRVLIIFNSIQEKRSSSNYSEIIGTP